MKHRVRLQFPAAQREMRMLPANFLGIDAFNAVGPHQILPVFIVFLFAAIPHLDRQLAAEMAEQPNQHPGRRKIFGAPAQMTIPRPESSAGGSPTPARN